MTTTAPHAPAANSATDCTCGRTFASHMGRRNHLTAAAKRAEREATAAAAIAHHRAEAEAGRTAASRPEVDDAATLTPVAEVAAEAYSVVELPAAGRVVDAAPRYAVVDAHGTRYTRTADRAAADEVAEALTAQLAATIADRVAALDALPTDDGLDDGLGEYVAPVAATEAPYCRCGRPAAHPEHASAHAYEPARVEVDGFGIDDEVDDEPADGAPPFGDAGAVTDPHRPSTLSLLLDGPAPAGLDLRPVGADLYEVVRDSIAAGRVMLGDTSWHGYDLAGTRVTGLGCDTLAEALAAVVALGCTPDHPRPRPTCHCTGGAFAHWAGARGCSVAGPVGAAVTTWGGRMSEVPATLRALDEAVAALPAEVAPRRAVPAAAARAEVTATVDTLDTLRARLAAAEGDLVAAREAEQALDPGTRDRRLASRRRRHAGRRVTAAQAAVAAAEG